MQNEQTADEEKPADASGADGEARAGLREHGGGERGWEPDWDGWLAEKAARRAAAQGGGHGSALCLSGLGGCALPDQLGPDEVPVVGPQALSANSAIGLTLDHDTEGRAGNSPVLLNCQLGQIDGRDANACCEFGNTTARESVQVGSEFGEGMHIAQLLPKHSAYQRVMQVAYPSQMEETESPRKKRRRLRLELLLQEFGGAAQVARESGTPKSHFSAMVSGARGLGDTLASKLEGLYAKPEGWFDLPIDEPAAGVPASPAPAPHEAPTDAAGGPPDLVIAEYATGGGMDTKGQLLLDDQPGIIRSWRVTQEWLRLNVPNHTGLRNLCIVTGFGPSMRPMFNPGDPLLVDTGVKVVNHEGVYFFRVGEEGFIKLIQRVPEFDGPGFSLRIISKNPDYPPYDISPRNPHFEVLGKVLTVWRSEQY